MTIKEAVSFYSEKLNNTDSPVREARLLVGLCMGLSQTEVIVHENATVPQSLIKKLEKFVERRSQGEPFAYIAGEKEFLGHKFKVNKNVLIPRPDTEILVNFAAGKEKTVLDLCTGSGCIAVSLARLMPWAEVTAVDCSAKALEVAKENAEINKVQVEFIKKDILKSKIDFKRKFELVVSNPPYIEEKDLETLEKDVKEFEPLLALNGGADGLIFYRKIVADAQLFLESGGRLCFEIGYNQGEAVKKIMEEKFEDIKIIKDYSGLDRVVIGTLKKDLPKKHNHNGHRNRLRDRFLKEGLDGFQPHEVLELLLFYSIPRRDVNEKAHELISQFGSLSGVLEADVSHLVEKGKVTENTAVLLKLIPALSRVYMKDRWKEKAVLSNTFVAGKFAADLFVGSTYEEFCVICLSNNKGVIKCEKISKGTVNETAVYPRLVVEAAIRNKAGGIILAHNHPSGVLTPSWTDVEITEKIASALENIDITFIDHFIVGGDKFLSMAEGGYLKGKGKI